MVTTIWFSTADEHPNAQVKMRAGETWFKTYILTETDANQNPIGAKDFTDYDAQGFYFTVAATPGGAQLIKSTDVTVQGDPTEGKLRLVAFSADTQTVFDSLKGGAGYMSVFGVPNLGSNDPNERDLLWTASVAVYPSTA